MVSLDDFSKLRKCPFCLNASYKFKNNQQLTIQYGKWITERKYN